MSTNYSPKEEISYYYEEAENMLFMEATITVPVNEGETLTLINNMQGDNETNIEFKVTKSSDNAQNPFTTTIKFPLMRVATQDATETQLRKNIKAFVSDKHKLKIKVKSAGVTVGQKTSKISGDAYIKTT